MVNNKLHLTVEQSQKLVMTNQLQLAIQLLQMSNLEVEQLIHEELQKNPFLQENDSFYEDTSSWNSPKSSNTNDDYDFFEQSVAESKDLSTSLIEQLHIAVEDKMDQFIGHMLIDALDESGYFTKDLQTFADENEFSLEDVARLIAICKTFEPSGVFSANLKECLSIQLQDQGLYDGKIVSLLDHLDLLGDKNYKKIQQICNCDKSELQDMIQLIQTLHPKPALAFDDLVSHTITPDIYVGQNTDQEWYVELTHNWLGKIQLDSELFEAIQNTANKQDLKFANEQWKEADWLVRAIKQRDLTLMRVTKVIMDTQKDFFEKGVSHLKPMVLKDIAKQLDLHESTISRITTNKYLTCQYGTFELKYFFTAALNRLYKTNLMNEDHSAEAIRHRIQELIQNENPQKILSDDSIASILSEEGIEIARRTVAKYREAMKIPTSAHRKRAAKSELYFAE